MSDLIQVENLRKEFPVQKSFLDQVFAGRKKTFVHAVDDISFTIKKGEVLVNGEQSESGLWVSQGQKIELVEPEININQLYEIDIKVPFEDDYIAGR